MKTPPIRYAAAAVLIAVSISLPVLVYYQQESIALGLLALVSTTLTGWRVRNNGGNGDTKNGSK